MPVLLATDSLVDAVTEFSTVFSKVFTVITGNWYLFALILVPLGIMVVSGVLSFIRRNT